MLINFNVKNRYRNYFYVRDVKVYSSIDGSEVELDRELYMEKYGIRFDEILRGAVGFRVKDYYTPEYIIELIEEAGKKRKVRLKVGF